MHEIANSPSQNKSVKPLRYLSAVFFSLLLAAHPAWARMDKELMRSYKIAKRYYYAGDFVAAQAVLEPLISCEEPNDLVPYAQFYYALSAYYLEDALLAEKTFTTLMEMFPDWVQKDEVWYWLGKIKFDAKDYEAGLGYLTNITSQELVQAAELMKTYFLQQLNDPTALKTLLSTYPQDRVIAQVLLDLLVRQPFIDRDAELLNTLVRDFSGIRRLHDPLEGLSSYQKDRYNVAVLFPFFADEEEGKSTIEGPFMDLYRGIKSAIAVLASQGIEINLFAYDTQKDPETTADLLKQEEIRSMDLIISSLADANALLLGEFARTQQINLFDPLAEQVHAVGDNPFFFLFKSSLETQARKAAEFTLQHAAEESRIGIIYGISAEDSIQAHSYQQYIEQHTHKKVALMLPIAPEEAQHCLPALRGLMGKEAEGVQKDEEEGENMPNLGELVGLTHVYVASKNELIAANVLSAIEILKLNPCIVGHEAWLERGALTLDQLQRLQLYLIAPDHIDYKKEGVHNFRIHFYDQFLQYPTSYACIGHDMMLFLGCMLDQYGVYFQKHWAEKFSPGNLFEGVTYGVYHDNQHVPIVQFQGDQFVVCNRPF